MMIAYWLCFRDLDVGASTPDTDRIRLFRAKPTAACALEPLFADFDRYSRERDSFALDGKIVDATMIAASKRRNPKLKRMRSKPISPLLNLKCRSADLGDPCLGVRVIDRQHSFCEGVAPKRAINWTCGH